MHAQIRFGSPLLKIMSDAVYKAARGLIRDFGEIEHLQVSKKGPKDFVTAADLRSEGILKEELKKARPEYGFLMEESGEEKGAEPSCRWVIDPLDGTKNFMHGVSYFAISIAAQENEQTVAAVTYDPIKDEMFWAEKGRGAFVNNQRLRVSSRVNAAEALVATGLPASHEEALHQTLEDMKNISRHVSGVRAPGAAALDMAYLAAGRFDVFWNRRLNPWDVAAGILLIQEAGGVVKTIGKEALPYEGKDVFATNGKLLSTVEKILK